MFSTLKSKFQEHFKSLVLGSSTLFLTDVDKELLWNTYITSFPEGTDPVFKVRSEHDCSACKSFIRNYGNIVIIKDNKLISIWDFEVKEPYGTVVKALSTLVKSKPVVDRFITKFPKLGTNFNIQMLEDKSTVRWEHLFFELPKVYVNNSKYSVESLQSPIRDTKNVFKRSLDEITADAKSF